MTEVAAITKPKRERKPVPAPLGTSASGRKRYRVTVAEHEQIVGILQEGLTAATDQRDMARAERDAAQRASRFAHAKATKYQRLAVVSILASACAGWLGAVLW